jgi:hypothetical protein
MPRAQSKFQGKVICSQIREVVGDVYKFMKGESDAAVPTNLKKTQKRTTEGRLVSERFVRKLMREMKVTESGPSTSLTCIIS